MTNSYEWGIKNEREQLGKLIKLIVSTHSDETLGKWYQTLQKSLAIVEEDGRYSKEGLYNLDAIIKGIRYLITEVSDKK